MTHETQLITTLYEVREWSEHAPIERAAVLG
jgi:hypothetical protein